MFYALVFFCVFIGILVENWEKLDQEFILNFKFPVLGAFRDQISHEIVKLLFLSVLGWSDRLV